MHGGGGDALDIISLGTGPMEISVAGEVTGGCITRALHACLVWNEYHGGGVWWELAYMWFINDVKLVRMSCDDRAAWHT